MPPVSPQSPEDNRVHLKDRLVIYCTAFLRAAGTGMTGVLMGVYLARLSFSPAAIGVMVAAGLAGGAAAALIATLVADSVGRRSFLCILGMLGAIGGLIVAFSSSAIIITVAAFFGMVNGMGKDRGASLVLEQAVLPGTTSDQERTAIFAFYNVIQAAGAAAGALLAGSPTLLHDYGGISQLTAMRLVMASYGLFMLVTASLYPALSAAVEKHAAPAGFRHVSNETRHVLIKLSALFAIDSIGGGFLTEALIAYFFVARFGVGAGTVGLLFFGAHVANAASQFGAAFLARRIGLINTMVFTHIPSNLILIAVAFSPNFPLAAALFIVRECLVQMDVPARQSYVMAIVQPQERTFASGVTSLVRLGGWAVAPTLAGLVMQSLSVAMPLVIGPALKVSYDLLLFRAFRALKPPEELPPARTSPREQRRESL